MKRKAKKSPKADALHVELCRQVEKGIFAPGQRIPPELLLAKTYKVSRGTVRKVLRRMADEGRINWHPGHRRVTGDTLLSGSIVRTKLTGTLRLLTYWPTLSAENIARILASFQMSFPRVKVDILRINSTEERDELSRLCQAGRPPDVVHLPSQYLDDICLKTPMVPVDDILDADLLDDIYPTVQESLTIDEKLVAYPFCFSPVMLAYNQTHFEEAGISRPDESWTWSHWLEAMDRLASESTAEKPRYGFAFTPQFRRWGAFLAQAGGKEALDWRKTPAMTVEGVAKACQFVYDLSQRPSVIRALEMTAKQMFSHGFASMTLCTLLGLREATSCNFETNVAPVPWGSHPGTLLLAYGFAVPRASQNSLVARQFLRFLSTPEAQTILRCSGAGVPPRRQIAENMQFDTEFVHPEGYLHFAHSLDHAYSVQRGLTPEVDSASTLLFGKFLMGLLNADELCRQVDDILDNRAPITDLRQAVIV